MHVPPSEQNFSSDGIEILPCAGILQQDGSRMAENIYLHLRVFK